ncbi:MAG: thermonuclease family protein [Actinomycetota bacterium]
MKCALHIAALACALATASACSAPAPTVHPPRAVVVEIVDGDTLVVSSGARTETVRLIGIDTPEVAHHGRPGECFGPEAAVHLASLAPVGSIVELSVDEEPRDIYGRLLAYVRTATVADVALQLALDGMADALAIEPNLATADPVAAAVGEARRAGRGLWGACPEM